MGIKLGFIDSNAYANLHSLDYMHGSAIVDSPNITSQVNPSGGSFVSRNANKARIMIEEDLLTQANLANIRKSLYNRTYTEKVYIDHPAGSNQQLNFNGITNPSATHEIRFAYSDNPSRDWAHGTEIATADYQKIYDIGATNYEADSAVSANEDYTFIFFRVSLGDIAGPGTGWMSMYGADYIQRLTLLLHNPYCENSGNRDGFKISAYNNSATEWVEVKRQNYSITQGELAAESLLFQQFAALRPVEGFTKFSDFITAGFVYFRICNFNQGGATGVKVGFNYAELLINGFGCSWINEDDFKYRDPYTGAGWQGTMELLEL